MTIRNIQLNLTFEHARQIRRAIVKAVRSWKKNKIRNKVEVLSFGNKYDQCLRCFFIEFKCEVEQFLVYTLSEMML